MNELEQYLGDNFLLITQNVDNLHRRAGSNNLIHMHGELALLRCENCHEIFTMMEEHQLTDDYVECPSCDMIGCALILFGFMKFHLDLKRFTKLLRNVMYSLQLVPVAMYILLLVSSM